MKYYLLGKSGLRVSELALGTMTFGTDWGWGSTQVEAKQMLDLYLERGGNFIDTANGYTNGSSEKILGEIIGNRRDSLVLATKYTQNIYQGDPNGGGNHRKSMVRSVENSLKRMKTDYIDLLYLHAWDDTTPVEEILRGMDDLVRSGKVLYAGISDTTAWQVSRMQTIADLRGWTPLIALQIEYSLAERTTERELIPMAKEMGLGVVAWSPLSKGLLTGKYSVEELRSGVSKGDFSRKAMIVNSGVLNDQVLATVALLIQIADEINKPAAEVALAWLRSKQSVTSILIGASKLKQLESNLNSLDLTLSDDHLKSLNEVSEVDMGFPHRILANSLAKTMVFGGVDVMKR